jgi:hypothetical protein
LITDLSARIAAATDSPTFRRINPQKTEVILMHIGAQLGGGRLLSRAEVAALPLEALESAVSRALDDFPTWAQPKAPPLRATPSQRLEDANRELAEREARKATQRRSEQPTPAPATKKAALNALPAHLRLAAANGDRQLSHLIEKK